MENQIRPEDEINYRNLLKDPVRLFAIIYPYIFSAVYCRRRLLGCKHGLCL